MIRVVIITSVQADFLNRKVQVTKATQVILSICGSGGVEVAWHRVLEPKQDKEDVPMGRAVAAA